VFDVYIVLLFNTNIVRFYRRHSLYFWIQLRGRGVCS